MQALHEAGLRVVQDVVYNHTYASGLDRYSVLDKVVPGYYHRRTETGQVCDSTCAPHDHLPSSNVFSVLTHHIHDNS